MAAAGVEGEPSLGVWRVLKEPSCGQLPDTAAFLATLSSLASQPRSSSPHSLASSNEPHTSGQCEGKVAGAGALFDWNAPLYVSRAPGRMDVMGGIADYSGSLVLQMPIEEAAYVAVQRQPGRGPGTISAVSISCGADARASEFRAPLADLFPNGAPLDYPSARSYFQRDASTSWAAYIVGCLPVAAAEAGVEVCAGESVSVLVSSAVPEGKGVSSSAAVEVATMSALLAAYNVQVDGTRLATLCQRVENRVAGAPCGIMDQMASTLGRRGALLALLCQPAEVVGWPLVPARLAVWGIDSGVRHAVSGSDYGAVRAGAFMGRRILSSAAEAQSEVPTTPLVPGGYLVNIPPSLWSERCHERLPHSLSGERFTSAYGSHGDDVTSIDPMKEYAIRDPASHPVHEHSRVNLFSALLQSMSREEATGTCDVPASTPSLLGELMFQSHASYTRVGLGCHATDTIVNLVRQEISQAIAQGEQPALYGAKITGGGCGGTVCILGSKGPAGEAAVQRVLAAYAAQVGSNVTLFQGSSPGAEEFGHMVISRAP